MNFWMVVKVGKERFLPAMAALSQAFALAGASDEAARIRDEVAFFQAACSWREWRVSP